MQQTAELRTLLSDCRTTDVLARLDRMMEANAEEARCARARLHELDQRPKKVARPEPKPQADASQEAKSAELQQAQEQIEQLTHKLATAQAEIRRCQTSLFAYEREIRALQQENAELEETLHQVEEELGIKLRHEEPPLIAASFPPARAVVQLLPPTIQNYTPNLTVAPEQPRSTGAVAERRDSIRCVQTPKRTPPPQHIPSTSLEKLAAQLVERMNRLM
jgi:hypothetical protein